MNMILKTIHEIEKASSFSENRERSWKLIESFHGSKRWLGFKCESIMNHAYIVRSSISISTDLIYSIYGSIRIEEIHTANTTEDRYLNYDGKDEISIWSKHKWKTFLFNQPVHEYTRWWLPIWKIMIVFIKSLSKLVLKSYKIEK